MPLPEGYLPREGDILTFRAQVRHNVTPGEDHVHVTKPGSTYSNLVLDLKDVEGLHCRHWEVGSRVRARDDHDAVRADPDAVGEVIGVDGDQVWVNFPMDGRSTYEANELEDAADSTPHLIAAAPPPGLDPV